MTEEWTDVSLTTTDPKEPIHIKKKHIDELVFSNPALEVDTAKKDIVHRIMEYSGDRLYGTMLPQIDALSWKWFGLYCWDIATEILKLIGWDSEKEEVVSKIKEPPTGDTQGNFLTPQNTTKTRGNFIRILRGLIGSCTNFYPPKLHSSRFTGQSIKELITGEAREGYQCPRCNPAIGVLPSELFCSYCRTDWEQKENGKWFPATWTDPIIHYPLVFRLQQDYPKGTTAISFSDYAGRTTGCLTITQWTVPVAVSQDFKKQRYADYSALPEGVPSVADLKQGLPARSFIVFDNHFAQYTIQNPSNFWIKEFYEGEDDEKFYPYKVKFWFYLDSPLKFDVKKGSWIQIFPWRLAQIGKKDEDTIIIDSANYFWMDFEEVCKRGGERYIPALQNFYLHKRQTEGGYIDHYFYPGISLNFREGEAYTIKEAQITSDGNIEITLNEKLVSDIEEGRGLFLFTPIKAKHIEELRNALDNLKWEGEYPRYVVWGDYLRAFRYTNYPSPTAIAADPELPFSSASVGGIVWFRKIRMSIDVKGIPRYKYQSGEWLGNRRPIGQGQVVDNKYITYRVSTLEDSERWRGWRRTAVASGTETPWEDLGLGDMAWQMVVAVHQGLVISRGRGRHNPAAKNCPLRAAGWEEDESAERSYVFGIVDMPHTIGETLYKDEFHEEGE